MVHVRSKLHPKGAMLTLHGIDCVSYFGECFLLDECQQNEIRLLYLHRFGSVSVKFNCKSFKNTHTKTIHVFVHYF